MFTDSVKFNKKNNNKMYKYIKMYAKNIVM